MPFIAGPLTNDFDTELGSCTYPRFPLTAGFYTSPNVFINGVPATIYVAASVPAPVPGIWKPVCIPGGGARTMQLSKNTNVFINSQLFAVGEPAGTLANSDATVIAAGGVRPLTGPYLAEQPPNKQVNVNPPIGNPAP